MVTGTVKSFNRLKGYGFIRTDSGKEVFVHLSAVQKAGLADLRKGQKISFEMFDNQGKAAAKNLWVSKTMKDASKHKLVAIQNGVMQNARREMMKPKNAEQLKGKRTSITRAALELAIAETVRGSDPQCEGLIGIIVERVVPESHGAANWVVKGVKYGKAERDRCSAAISDFVKEGQREFEVSDWSSDMRRTTPP
jgi:CspA family cold shock protein